MNKTEEIYEYLRTYAYPYYENAPAYYKVDMEDAAFRGVLDSLSVDELKQLFVMMESDGCPYRLYLKVKGLIRKKEREELRLIPTESLLSWYADKNRKYRNKPFDELTRRFRNEELNMKCAILRAFIEGRVKEMEWAARQLRDGWIESFSDPVRQRWEQTHNQLLGYVILRHFPDSYILEQQEELASATGYAYVCARVGSCPGFTIDTKRLSIPDQFYVAAKLGLPVKPDDMEKLLRKYMRGSFVSPLDFRLICWSLGKLGMTYLLMQCGIKLIKNNKQNKQ